MEEQREAIKRKFQNVREQRNEGIEEKVTNFYVLRASQWLEQSSDEAQESTSDEAPWILCKA